MNFSQLLTFTHSEPVASKLFYCLLQMDNDNKVKKKRVLPQWMLEPEKSKTKPMDKFFKPVEKKKVTKAEEEKPFVYVMSPYELEQTARLILAELDN